MDIILRHVVSTLNGTESRFRSQSLKSLTTLIEADPDIIGNVSIKEILPATYLPQETVKSAVCKRLLDEKPSVRKEAVDLLGTFVLSKPGLADTYYDELMARLMV